jgi:hypothetical protein
MRNSHWKYLIVRYEDLWDDLEKELGKIFDFLDLNPTLYDFEAAAKLPVRGSSVFGKVAEDDVHWSPVEKDKDFNPIARWAHWPRSRHERFNWVAGKYLRECGYEEKSYPGHHALWTIWNKGLDIKWKLDEMSKSAFSLAHRLSQKIFRMDRLVKSVSLLPALYFLPGC